MSTPPEDPHLWLEQIHAEDALAWAAARTAETESRYASPERSGLEARLRGILDDPARIVIPSRRGEWMYDLRRDAAHPRGVWRRSSRQSFLAGAPEWQTLLDVDALGAAEGVPWAFAGAWHGPTGTGRVLVGLSPDGGDARVVREYDLGLAGFVDAAQHPFALDVDKSAVAWLDADTLLVATGVAGGAVTDSGYPATVRVWSRGTPLADASVVLTADRTDVGAFVHVDRSGGRATAVVVLARDFFHSDVHVWRHGDGVAPVRIAAPSDAHVDVHGDLVAVRTTTDWDVAGERHPGGTLLVGPVESLTHGDGSALRVAFAPSHDTVLASWRWTASRLVLDLLENVQSRLVSLDPAAEWASVPLERGGVFVVAGIRGGGEFGPAWHLAALRENRHRAYEDFAAVARDLVARGVSSPARIGCHGRSNGGLLVGNMLTTYPEDFGAIVCGVPLLDMRRYTRLSAGASWIAEYGDPDDPADWEFIRTFSPYHLIDPARTYPPSLIYAATSDDRVGPVQARKMAARLREETDAEVHYLEPVEGGHAGTIDNAATAALHATIHAFLADALRL